MPGDYLLILYNTASGSAGKHVKSPSFLPWGYLNALGFFFRFLQQGSPTKVQQLNPSFDWVPVRFGNRIRRKKWRLSCVWVRFLKMEEVLWCTVEPGAKMYMEGRCGDLEMTVRGLSRICCFVFAGFFFFFCSFSLTFISQSDTEKDRICIWRLTNILYDIILYFKSLFWQ